MPSRGLCANESNQNADCSSKQEIQAEARRVLSNTYIRQVPIADEGRVAASTEQGEVGLGLGLSDSDGQALLPIGQPPNKVEFGEVVVENWNSPSERIWGNMKRSS